MLQTGVEDDPRAVSVLLVTEVRMYADGLTQALRAAPAIGAVTAAATCRDALALLHTSPADVVVLDLAGLSDLTEARFFVRAADPARVVALAVRESDHDVVRWAEHGVAGILTRRASFDDLLHAVLSAAGGECGCSPAVAAVLLRRVAEVAADRRAAAAHAPLTSREREIAECLVVGMSNKEIAARLVLGVSTVKNHVHHVLGKVEARTRTEAVARLVAAGIQSPPVAGSGHATAERG